jgi:hypothetical protein
MTGIVLALAGLTCGDGGPGMGAAREPVTASSDGSWEGPWKNGENTTLRVEMKDGSFDMILAGFDIWKVSGRPSPAGRGRGTVEMVDRARLTFRGIYKAEPGILLICVNNHPDGTPPTSFQDAITTRIIILRPAARKP